MPHALRLQPLLLACLTALTPALASAKCASSHLDVWPPPGTPLPANGRVVVEGFGTDQPLVVALGEVGQPAHAWLEGAGGRVPLMVESRNIGHLQLTQAILRPTKPLKVGTTYRLLLTRGHKVFSPRIWMASAETQAAWTVVAADEVAPGWRSAPALGARNYTMLGCGPAVGVQVQVDLEEATPAAVEVTLEGPQGTQRWLTPVVEGAIDIGHGMCSGAFDVAGPGDRVATLVAVDLAGHRTAAVQPIRFAGVEESESK